MSAWLPVRTRWKVTTKALMNLIGNRNQWSRRGWWQCWKDRNSGTSSIKDWSLCCCWFVSWCVCVCICVCVCLLQGFAVQSESRTGTFTIGQALMSILSLFFNFFSFFLSFFLFIIEENGGKNSGCLHNKQCQKNAFLTSACYCDYQWYSSWEIWTCRSMNNYSRIFLIESLVYL